MSVKQKTPCTPLEVEAIKALGRCRFGVGSSEKRFVRDNQAATELTQAQREWLYAIYYRYRKQMGLTPAQAKEFIERMKSEKSQGEVPHA